MCAFTLEAGSEAGARRRPKTTGSATMFDFSFLLRNFYCYTEIPVPVGIGIHQKVWICRFGLGFADLDTGIQQWYRCWFVW